MKVILADDETPLLCSNRAGRTMQSALRDVSDPVPQGWPASRRAGVHEVGDVHQPARRIPGPATFAPPGLGRTHDASPILRNGALRSRARDPGHDQYEPDPAKSAADR